MAMKTLNYILFYGWAGALLVLGATGIFTSRWELETIFQINLDAMGAEALGSMLNEYRFLKSIEFGFGLFCFLFRKEIFTIRLFNRLFLAIVFVGVLARALAIAVDGWPHWGLVAVTIFEFLTGVVVMIYSRRTLEKP